jgi:hypothetical protein
VYCTVSRVPKPSLFVVLATSSIGNVRLGFSAADCDEKA